jgi:hypothetical protein
MEGVNLAEFKQQIIREKLNVNKDIFGKVLSIIDFGNVNYWFEEDTMDADGSNIGENEKFSIDFKMLFDFLYYISEENRFYFGHDPNKKKSLGLIGAARSVFGKRNVITKPMQFIKHFIKDDEITTREINQNVNGRFILIPKCNFDVEISIDSIRLAQKYDTLCLLSGDSDFMALAQYLKSNLDKKVILIKSGFIKTEFYNLVDLVINAQDIKQYIAIKKQKSRP